MGYIEINKSMRGESMPTNIVRLRVKSVAISPNIAEKFQSKRETTPSGWEKVTLGLAADKDANRIKLIPTAVNGFAFRALEKDSVLNCTMPTGLRRLGLPLGDYRLVDEESLEFELAR